MPATSGRKVVIGTGESHHPMAAQPRLQTFASKLPGVHFKFLNLPTDDAVKTARRRHYRFPIVRPTPGASVEVRDWETMDYALFVPPRP